VLLLPFLLRTPPTTSTPTLPLSLLFLSGARGVRTCVVALAWPPNGVLTGHDGLEVRGAGRGAHQHPRELGDALQQAALVAAQLPQHARGRPHGCSLGRRALVGRTGWAATGGAEDKDEDEVGRVVGGEEVEGLARVF